MISHTSQTGGNRDITILIVDDDVSACSCIEAVLQQQHYRIISAHSVPDAVAVLPRHSIDLVLTDLRIGADSGLDLIRQIVQTSPETEIILMTAYGSIENAVEAIQSGACDYMSKPFSNQQLIVKVQKAVERKLMKKELIVLRQQVAMSYGFDNIVGISKPMSLLKDAARRVAPTDITILITGPSGTGKELFARAIHHHSNRRNGNFVAVDCNAIPEALLESELFGHTRGSFTSAVQSKKGLFEEADNGTLFLDEVSNMPTATQAKLLRFLQDSEIRQVGALTSKKVNVRIIAATNRDLKEMSAQGTFREDLYYRLNVIPLYLPPLVERAEDIEMLTEYFLRKIAHDTNAAPRLITRPAIEKLLTYHWPGNVRELENTLKRGAALCHGNQIEAEDIVFIAGARTATVDVPDRSASTLTIKGGLLDNEQRTLILKTLTRNRWNFTRTAEELGIGRTTLWRKVKKYNLARAIEEAGVPTQEEPVES
jgi:two-component system response regulator HydG